MLSIQPIFLIAKAQLCIVFPAEKFSVTGYYNPNHIRSISATINPAVHLHRYLVMTAQGLTSSDQLQRLTALPKPLLVWGGAGLVLAAGYTIAHLPGIELLGWAGVAGATLWSTRKLWRREDSALDARSLTTQTVNSAIAQTRLQLEQWIREVPEQDGSVYATQLIEIEQSLTRQTLELQIVGTRTVGKTALKQRLIQQSNLFQQRWNLAGLDERAAESVVLPEDSPLPDSANPSDVILFVVQGDLTQLEWTALQQLQNQQKRVLLILNKQDQYLPAQAELVLAQLRQRVQGVVAEEDVVAIATTPQPIKVRRHQSDGSCQETLETPLPQIQPLLDRMQTVAVQEVSQLVLQRAYRQTLALQQTIQADLNRVRRDRALPILERYQWIAAGVAFANPLPSLDMVATAAITGKMIQELAGVYQIQLSLDRATEIAGVLGKNLIQMGLVEASSQVLSLALKGNTVTYVAGGMLQGVGAAYFTHMAGLSLVELFEVHRTTESWQLDSTLLSQIVQRIFKASSRMDVLKDLVQHTLRRFRSEEAAIASV
jgi:uncharacterized protein